MRVNWDQIADNWKHLKGRAKEHWARLTEDDLTYINGRRDELIGRVRARYGLGQADAERQVKDWGGSC
jgi:uncharacterized protein YjbJ (UPF0337 family)